jgi:hypothetical protein
VGTFGFDIKSKEILGEKEYSEEKNSRLRSVDSSRTLEVVQLMRIGDSLSSRLLDAKKTQ